jgi:hypothetical protein
MSTEGDDFFGLACSRNFKIDADDSINIGYSHQSWPFYVIPSLSLLLNISVIITHYRRSRTKKSK